jgi:hypothetical protein
VKSARAMADSPNPRRDKAVDNDGLRYSAMESALRPPLPTATPAGFKSESVASFLLECVAGFVGIHNLNRVVRPLRRRAYL